VPFTHGPTEATEFQPVYRAQVMADLLLTYPAQWSMTQLNRALCCFEQGQTEEARILLQQLLRYEPESEFRPVVAFYLNCATGERVPVEGPSQQIPVWGEMFAPDVPSGSGTDASPAGASESGTGAAASPEDDRAPDDRR
jgi:hypothetical protein